jgi:hypothetical protein
MKLIGTLIGVGVLISSTQTVLASTVQFAARGVTEADGCTRAHNEAGKWLSANSWKWTAQGKQAPSEGQCHCNGGVRTGFYCEVPVSD